MADNVVWAARQIGQIHRHFYSSNSLIEKKIMSIAKNQEKTVEGKFSRASNAASEIRLLNKANLPIISKRL